MLYYVLKTNTSVKKKSVVFYNAGKNIILVKKIKSLVI